MARPLSQGLTYFSLDVDMAGDDKIAYVESRYGPVAFAVFVRLLMKIYKNGCYMLWTEKEKYLFSRSMNVEADVAETIVQECINEGLFNKALYNTYKILTSKGIQKRYLAGCTRRKAVSVYREFFLLHPETDLKDFKPELQFIEFDVDENEVNVNINCNDSDINVDTNEVHVNITSTETPQSKVKKSKVKESKVLILAKANIIESTTLEVEDPELKISCRRIVDLYHELCPRLAKVRMITLPREKKIKAWLKKLGDESSFEEVFQKLGASDFCCGINDRGWQANFDWILNQSNWAKVLEGKYDNKKLKQGEVKNHFLPTKTSRAQQSIEEA